MSESKIRFVDLHTIYETSVTPELGIAGAKAPGSALCEVSTTVCMTGPGGWN